MGFLLATKKVSMKRVSWLSLVTGFVLAVLFIPGLASGDHNPFEINISAVDGSDPDQFNPDIAYDYVNGNFLVVWRDTRCASSCFYGARVRASDGTILDPGGFQIISGTSSNRPDVAFDGQNFLVVFTGSSSVVGVRVRASDGQVLDPGGFQISSMTGWLAGIKVAFDGTNYLVVWAEQQNSTTQYDIYGTRVRASDLEVLDPGKFVISDKPDWQIQPAIAFDGVNYLVVWQDQIALNDTDIYGTRVRASDGAVLDGPGIPIAEARNFQQDTAVAFDGTNYLVVWNDSRNDTSNSAHGGEVYGARVNRDGVVLDSDGIPISTAPGVWGFPSVAFDGANYLVVWTDYRNNPATLYDIYGTRVQPDGLVLDPQGIGIFISPNYQVRPELAFGGDRYLIVQQDQHMSNYDIYGKFFFGTEPSGPQPPVISSIEVDPAAATDLETCVLVGTQISMTVYASDPDGGDITLYELDTDGDGMYDLMTTTSPGTFNFHYDDVGTRSLNVRVTDDEGQTTTASVDVCVVGPETELRVWIAQPKDGESIWGDALTLHANTAPGVITQSVEFRYRPSDGLPFPDMDDPSWIFIGSLDAPAYSFKLGWDVTGLETGTYDLIAVATDIFLGQVSSQVMEEIRVTVDPLAKIVETASPRLRIAPVDPSKTTVSTMGVLVTVEIPAGAVLSEDSLMIAKITDDLHAEQSQQQELQHVSFWDINLQSGSLLKPATVTLNYLDEDQDGVVDGTVLTEQSLLIYRFDEVDQVWEPLFYQVVDLTANTVTASTTSFSDFALTGPATVVENTGGGNDSNFLGCGSINLKKPGPPPSGSDVVNMAILLSPILLLLRRRAYAFAIRIR
jgi:hypothetical protein